MDTVVKLTEPTQNSIFKNKYTYNQTLKETSVVYSKSDKKYIEIKRLIKLTLVGEDEKLYRGFNEFDMAVHNALCSFVDAGAESFSTEQLYRVMAGNQKKQLKPGTNISEEIELSLYKMMATVVRLKFDDECEKFGLDYRDDAGNKLVMLSANMLSLQMASIKMANGKTVDAWKILAKPPLYIYAKLKSQLETLNLSHLNTPLNITEDNIRLREYLLGRVLMIKGNTGAKGHIRKRYSNCEIIKFDSLYELFGIPVDGKKSEDIHKRGRLLKKCEKLFNYWKEDSGLLQDWAYVNTNGSADGFKLRINIEKFGSVREDLWQSEMAAAEMDEDNIA